MGMLNAAELAFAEIFAGLGGGGGGGNASFEPVDYIHFGGEDRITLPFAMTETRAFTVDFQPDAYVNYMIIAGNTLGNYRPHLTMYGNKYFVAAGSNRELAFDGDFTNRHVFKMNDNGDILFDDVVKGTYTSTDYSTGYFTIGYRQDAQAAANLYVGKIFGYSIYDTSVDAVICNLVPHRLSVVNNGETILNEYGLYDTVNKKFYMGTSFTGGNITE